MSDFRRKTPMRSIPVPVFDSYKKYKSLLRKDFNERCGYCGDHDFFRETYYEIDHFVPKECLRSISLSEYTNLVYSCRLCNNHKRKKWPTQDEKIHNDGAQGFIDPCDTSYANQFERLIDGTIHPMTALGDWMWAALNLGNPAHRIKYKLEEIKVLLDQIDQIKDLFVEELIAIKDLNKAYRDLEEQLKGKPCFT
jgi:HNH endonuclease domain-containing protein